MQLLMILLSNTVLIFHLSGEFAVGDVVWAKYYREPHWPAQVRFVIYLFIQFCQFLAGISQQHKPITVVPFRPDHNHLGQSPTLFEQ